MGCSNPHPHGQIWTCTGLPEEPALELAQLQKYRVEHGGSHMLEDYAALEVRKAERIVFENATFLAVCPWWATWPFETMIVSKKHKPSLVNFDDGERTDLAEAIAEVTRRYDNLFETQFPYSKSYTPASLILLPFPSFLTLFGGPMKLILQAWASTKLRSRALPPKSRPRTSTCTFTRRSSAVPRSESFWSAMR